MQYPLTAFIGAGNMATAIIAGLINNGFPAEKIIASNRGLEKLQKLSTQYAIKTTQNNQEAVKNADVIILAVKPNVMNEVCTEIADCIDQQLILSIAAGITIESIKKHLNTDSSVIRAMPNTPCLLSKGAVGIFVEAGVSTEQRQYVERLFNNIGEIVWLEQEKQLNVVTALSGSGPAYYFYLTEALIKAGIKLGLDEEISSKLVNQTALGAVAMLQEMPATSAQALRTAVTSPQGTTEAATNIFNDNNLMQIIEDAVRSATSRGEEMSREFD